MNNSDGILRLRAISQELGRRYIAMAEIERAEQEAKLRAYMEAKVQGETDGHAERLSRMASANLSADLNRNKADVKAFLEEKEFLMFAIEHGLLEAVA